MGFREICRQMLECDGGGSRCFLRHIWPSSLVEWLKRVGGYRSAPGKRVAW
jgi:hypothetical protein